MIRPEIAAAVYATLAIVLAYLLKPKFDARNLVLRVFAVWTLSTPIIFVVGYNMLALAMIAVIVAVFAPMRAENRVILYIATLAVIPNNYNADVPFPGLNYLITLNYPIISSLVLLGPIAVTALLRPKSSVSPLTDALVFLFFALVSIMSIRDLPFTSMLRMTFYELVSLVIPYIAISRTIVAKEAFEKVVWALLISGLILSTSGLISAFIHWNFYDFALPAGFPGIDIRGGALRVSATLATALLGFVAATGLISALYFRRDKRVDLIRLVLYAAIFPLVIYYTGSRGAILALFILGATYLVFTRMGGLVRRLYVVAGVIGAIAGFNYLRGGGAESIDAYGTFDYRIELLETSIEQIRARPLFGTTAYLESGRFDHLIQGQGIVDIVNGYLQIALEYGLVGLIIYLGMYFTVLKSLFDSSLRIRLRSADDEERALGKVVATCLALLVAYLALISTVSFVSYIPDYGVMLLGVSAGMAHYAKRRTGRMAEHS
ncbi:MAG: O-antigen ligase family protein [Parvularculaceae bacterium]